MTYLQRLHPWCIIRPYPDMRTIIVGRFRRRVDAVCEAWCEAAWDICESSSKSCPAFPLKLFLTYCQMR